VPPAGIFPNDSFVFSDSDSPLPASLHSAALHCQMASIMRQSIIQTVTSLNVGHEIQLAIGDWRLAIGRNG